MSVGGLSFANEWIVVAVVAALIAPRVYRTSKGYIAMRRQYPDAALEVAKIFAKHVGCTCAAAVFMLSSCFGYDLIYSWRVGRTGPVIFWPGATLVFMILFAVYWVGVTPRDLEEAEARLKARHSPAELPEPRD